jgi:hypothetical protein
MVDSAYPPGVGAWKGPAVRRLRCYVSWVIGLTPFVYKPSGLHRGHRPICANDWYNISY